MPCAEPYTGTTSLEFILNPFKLFFTTSVVHVTTNLEMQPLSPTILVRDALSVMRAMLGLQRHRDASIRAQSPRTALALHAGESSARASSPFYHTPPRLLAVRACTSMCPDAPKPSKRLQHSPLPRIRATRHFGRRPYAFVTTFSVGSAARGGCRCSHRTSISPYFQTENAPGRQRFFDREYRVASFLSEREPIARSRLAPGHK
jgi:hypothetical protein